MHNTADISPLVTRPADAGIVKPVVIRVQNFGPDDAAMVENRIADAHQTGQPIIPIVIDSYGGDGYALKTMISAIEHSELPVATIAVGKAMSAGAILLAWGARGHRYIDHNATVMLHDLAAKIEGKQAEMQAGIANIKRMGDSLYEQMAVNCKRRNKNYFLKKIAELGTVDWFMDAEEAKKHGIVDHIGVPAMRTNVSVEFEFGLDV